MSSSHVSSNTTSAAQSDTPLIAVSKPTDLNDTRAWKAYLGQIILKNMPGMKISNLYPVLVPAGNSDNATGLRQRQLELMHDIAARGVMPGIMLAFVGPDSGKTAEFVIEAFKDAKPDSFKDVIVLVVGDAGDKDKVTNTLQRTGATVRYANM